MITAHLIASIVGEAASLFREQATKDAAYAHKNGIIDDEARPAGLCFISTPQVRMNKNSLLNQN